MSFKYNLSCAVVNWYKYIAKPIKGFPKYGEIEENISSTEAYYDTGRIIFSKTKQKQTQNKKTLHQSANLGISASYIYMSSTRLLQTPQDL